MLKKGLSFLLLIVILLISLFLRINPVLENPESRRGGIGPFSDPELYHKLAVNLLFHKRFALEKNPLPQNTEEDKFEEVIFRGPGYPAFLALVYHFSAVEKEKQSSWPKIWQNVRIAQAILDSSLCLCLYLCLGLLFRKKTLPGLMAALIQCLNPFSIYYSRQLLTENLTAFCILWTVFFFFMLVRKKNFLFILPAIAFYSLLIFTRPEYMLFLAFLMPLLLIIYPDTLLKRFFYLFLFSLGLILFLIPWTYRNYREFGRLIPVASGSLGEMLYRGTFEGSYPWRGWGKFPSEIAEDRKEEKEIRSMYRRYLVLQQQGTKEILEIDAFFLQKAINRIKNHPKEVIRAWFSNIPRLWYQNYIQIFADPEPPGYLVLILLFLSLSGFFKSPRENKKLLLLVLTFPLYLSLLYLPLHIEPRYCLPLLPVLIIPASSALYLLFFKEEEAILDNQIA